MEIEPYKLRVKGVAAAQWDGTPEMAQELADWVGMSYGDQPMHTRATIELASMPYREDIPRKTEIRALKITYPLELTMGVGDWLVRDHEGFFRVYNHTYFKDVYEKGVVPDERPAE